MKDNKLIDIEKKVLENYKIYSPSKIPLEKKNSKKYFLRREKLFLDCLKLPKKIFLGANLLDLGCGTGEADLLYAKWGAKLNLVEINPKSVKQLRKYFSYFGLTKSIAKIENKSLFDYNSKKKFDIIVSEGVLHHTQNVEKGFKKLSTNLKSGGFCVLQVAFDSSQLQRNLQRFILDYLVGNQYSNKLIEEISEILFSETINRANKIGGRSKKQIIYDAYTNPKHKGVNLPNLLNIFKKNNINYYSSYPSIEPENLINGLHALLPSEHVLQNPNITAFQSLFFLLASYNDEKLIKNYSKDLVSLEKKWKKLLKETTLSDYEYGSKINPTKISNYFNVFAHKSLKLLSKRNSINEKKLITFANELKILMDILKTKDIKKIKNKINNFKILFRGYNGVPSNYIVGYKK